MITVSAGIYRALWIVCAVLSALMLAFPLLLLTGDLTLTDSGEALPTMIAFAVIGLVSFCYSLWRLLRPLRRPRPE